MMGGVRGVWLCRGIGGILGGGLGGKRGGKRADGVRYLCSESDGIQREHGSLYTATGSSSFRDMDLTSSLQGSEPGETVVADDARLDTGPSL